MKELLETTVGIVLDWLDEFENSSLSYRVAIGIYALLIIVAVLELFRHWQGS